MKIILGTGQVGLALLGVLVKQNPDGKILLVNRTGKLKIPLPANVQVMAADVTDRHKMECIVREADVVFSCTDVPYAQWKDYYPAAAGALAYALGRTGARLVFADNLYAYGNVSGAVMKESMPHNAATKKGRIRAAVIHRLLLSGDEFNHRVAIVKAADFIGPGIHKGIFGTGFLDKLYRGKTVYLFGKLQLPHTFTYINDFAEAMAAVANETDAFGQVWHVPNATAVSPEVWIKLFEQETGKKASIKTVPKGFVRMAGLVNSFIRELFELSYQFEHPWLVDHANYVKRFGNHATGHSVIVKETVRRYRQSTGA